MGEIENFIIDDFDKGIVHIRDALHSPFDVANPSPDPAETSAFSSIPLAPSPFMPVFVVSINVSQTSLAPRRERFAGLQKQMP